MTANDDLFEAFLNRCEPELPSTAERHRRLRTKLIKFFVWMRCEDAEGLADETIGRLVANIYSGEKIENPSGYALGTARNVYREYFRKSVRFTQVFDEAEAETEKQQTDPSDPFLECATLCFQKLSHDKRVLLEQYYSEEGNRGELARQEGFSIAGLRTKIHRIKTDLKECYRKCIGGQVS